MDIGPKNSEAERKTKMPSGGFGQLLVKTNELPVPLCLGYGPH